MSLSQVPAEPVVKSFVLTAFMQFSPTFTLIDSMNR